MLNVGRVNDEGGDSLHGGGHYRARATDQSLPLLLLLLDDFLPLLVLPPPLLMGSVYIRLLLIINDLEGSAPDDRRGIRKVRRHLSVVRREVRQFRRRRRRFSPSDFREWIERLKRGRREGRRRRSRCGFREMSRHDRRIDRQDGRTRLTRPPMVTLRRVVVVLRVCRRSPPIVRVGLGRDYVLRDDGRVNRWRYVPFRDVKTSVLRCCHRHRHLHRGGPLGIGGPLVSRCIAWRADRTACLVTDELSVSRVGLKDDRLTKWVWSRRLLSWGADVGTIPSLLAPVTVPSRTKPVPLPLPSWHIIELWSGPRGIRIRVGHLRWGWDHRPSKRAIVVVS